MADSGRNYYVRKTYTELGDQPARLDVVQGAYGRSPAKQRTRSTSHDPNLILSFFLLRTSSRLPQLHLEGLLQPWPRLSYYPHIFPANSLPPSAERRLEDEKPLPSISAPPRFSEPKRPKKPPRRRRRRRRRRPRIRPKRPQRSTASSSAYGRYLDPRKEKRGRRNRRRIRQRSYLQNTEERTWRRPSHYRSSPSPSATSSSVPASTSKLCSARSALRWMRLERRWEPSR